MLAESLEGHNLGKYRVLEPLGRGGMARVYRAYHPQLDRYVAIKVLRSDLVEEEDFLRRFRREAQAVAALRHPNIVQVFDFDIEGTIYYMVMELLAGDTLRTRLNDYRARDERMPIDETVRIILDILDGLAYAHNAGMIHRDVKPANILLTGRGQAVLTDFGIAQIVGGTHYTVSGALMGTLAYMAPEQGLEGQCDARSDIYSLGIVLYEMLVGEPPFDAETPLAILMKHVNDPLPSPRKSVPAIPRPFERVVLKALCKQPQGRYQSAAEMSQALLAAVKKARIELPPTLSLPLSFTTAEAPSESVVVLSGTAREGVRGADFAFQDTDMSLSEKMAAQAAIPEGEPEPLPDSATAAQKAGTDRQPPKKQRRERQPRPPAARDRAVRAPREKAPRKRPKQGSNVTWAILSGLGLIAIGNLTAVFLGLATGRWGIFGRGWPFELLLIGMALAVIMRTTGSIWMLIPTLIVAGNGYLMSFYTITWAWRLWIFLWPVELLIILVPVFVTIRLADQPDGGRELSRRLSTLVWYPTLATTIIVVILGAILG